MTKTFFKQLESFNNKIEQDRVALEDAKKDQINLQLQQKTVQNKFTALERELARLDKSNHGPIDVKEGYNSVLEFLNSDLSQSASIPPITTQHSLADSTEPEIAKENLASLNSNMLAALNTKNNYEQQLHRYTEETKVNFNYYQEALNNYQNIHPKDYFSTEIIPIMQLKNNPITNRPYHFHRKMLVKELNQGDFDEARGVARQQIAQWQHKWTESIAKKEQLNKDIYAITNQINEFKHCLETTIQKLLLISREKIQQELDDLNSQEQELNDKVIFLEQQLQETTDQRHALIINTEAQENWSSDLAMEGQQPEEPVVMSNIITTDGINYDEERALGDCATEQD